MANPATTNGQEVWYGARVAPTTGEQRTGNTGDFETWYGARTMPDEYVAAASTSRVKRLLLMGVG